MLRRAGEGTIYNFGEVEFTLNGKRADVSTVYTTLFGELRRQGDGRRYLDIIFGGEDYAYGGRELDEVTPMMAVRCLRRVVKQIDKADGWDI
ncbi:MAG: hypothetical protein WC829_21790 [Hyphomicrobium sp.]|jgi:hypothetical protein